MLQVRGRSAANAGSVMLRADGGGSAETRYFPDALADVRSCSVALSVDVKTLEEKYFFFKKRQKRGKAKERARTDKTVHFLSI